MIVLCEVEKQNAAHRTMILNSERVGSGDGLGPGCHCLRDGKGYEMTSLSGLFIAINTQLARKLISGLFLACCIQASLQELRTNCPTFTTAGNSPELRGKRGI